MQFGFSKMEAPSRYGIHVRHYITKIKYCTEMDRSKRVYIMVIDRGIVRFKSYSYLSNLKVVVDRTDSVVGKVNRSK